MPSHLLISSVATITAGAVIILSFYLYRRKKRTQDVSPTRDKTENQENIYRPITDANQYSIHIVTSIDDHSEAVEKFVAAVHKVKLMGLDCEWVTRDNERQPIALLQLSSPLSESCLLFRLNQLSGNLPESVVKIMRDRNTLKVGVGVIDDAKKLLRDYRIITQGCLDLRHLVRRHLPRSIRGRPLSLRELANIILDHKMLKSSSVRCGNWEAVPLTQEQVDYAAEDAIIGTAIFLRVVAMKMKLERLECFLHEVTWKGVASLCQGILDVYPDLTNEGATNSTPKKATKNGRGVTPEDVQNRPLSRAYKARQSVMYHNCRLLAPDGMLLCTCDKRKAMWYIGRGLGELVCEEPMSVRLLFEPAGIPGPDREYYLQNKENKCTVCGTEDSYIRKNVVPHEYRRHFPEYLKKHSSHDVILLCLRCHQLSSAYDNIVRFDLAEKYDAPITNKSNAKLIEDPMRVRVRSSARALIKHQKTQNIPEWRLQELTAILQNFFEVEEIDDDLLQEAVTMDTKVSNESFAGSHGLKVVEGVKGEEDGLHEFERMWRKNFLDNMNPQFLPALWSVDHKHEASVCKKEDIS